MQEHYRHWICPFSCSGTFGTSAEHQNHLRRVHTEHLNEATMTSLSESCARESKTPSSRCPFCDEEKPTQNAWYMHVGHHLEQLALFALPKHLLSHDSDDDENEHLSESDVQGLPEDVLLSDEEVEVVNEVTVSPDEESYSSSALDENLSSHLHLIDRDGQVHDLPFSSFRKWQVMDDYITQNLLPSGPKYGNIYRDLYFLIGPDEKNIEAGNWETKVQPGMMIRMQSLSLHREEDEQPHEAVLLDDGGSLSSMRHVENKEDVPLDSSGASIWFNDGLGERHSFPFERCKDWKGIEMHIVQTFETNDKFHKQVVNGFYTLKGPDGGIIKPRAWNSAVQPGWEVSLSFWDPLPSAITENNIGVDKSSLRSDSLSDVPLDVAALAARFSGDDAEQRKARRLSQSSTAWHPDRKFPDSGFKTKTPRNVSPVDLHRHPTNDVNLAAASDRSDAGMFHSGRESLIDHTENQDMTTATDPEGQQYQLASTGHEADPRKDGREDESSIGGMKDVVPRKIANEPSTPGNLPASIRLTDMEGRTFNFHWHMCKTWKGMESVIKTTYLFLLDTMDPRIQQGHYDLISPDGKVIHPQDWDSTIQPGWNITMHLWPIEEDNPPV